MRRISLLFLLCCPLPCVSPAADGLIEISQACVADGCFPGDEPGFPVTIDQRGSYQLTSNLSPTAAGLTAIQILADGVSIDLRGFTVGFCLDPPQGVACVVIGVADGIEGSSVTDTTLRNGNVLGFTGLGVDLGRRARVEGLNIRANGGAGLRVLQNSLVEGNRISFNGGSGISLGAGTAWGSNVLVTNNPDFTGGGIATAPNLCTGALCDGERALGARRFYATPSTMTHAGTGGACDSGFRLAYAGELANPAALRYDQSRGRSLESALGISGGWTARACFSALWSEAASAWVTTEQSCSQSRPAWCIEE